MLKVLCFFVCTFIIACIFTQYTGNNIDSAVIVQFHHDTDCLRPKESYTWKTCDLMRIDIAGIPLFIPENFETDFSSIPKMFWFFIAPHKKAYVHAGVLHDYLYMCPSGLSRQQVDLIFYHALRSEDTPIISATLAYWAVRMFGGKYYQKDNECLVITQNDYDRYIEDIDYERI